MAKSIPKRKQIPGRIIQMKDEADLLLREEHYRAAILLYVLFAEQLLILAYLYIKREEDIEQAIKKREEFLKRKEDGNFTFGKVINETVPTIEIKMESIPLISRSPISDLVKNLNDIRNQISAHPHFALMLDPTNSLKKAFYDTNYYREVARRLRDFTRKKLGMETSTEIDQFINFGSPLVWVGRLDQEIMRLETLINKPLAEYCKYAAEELTEQIKPLIASLK